MTIEQARALLDALDTQITGLLGQFQQQSGLTIHSVQVIAGDSPNVTAIVKVQL